MYLKLCGKLALPNKSFLPKKSEAEKTVERGNELAKQIGLDVEFSTDEPLKMRIGSFVGSYAGMVGVYVSRPENAKKLPKEFCEKMHIAPDLI